MKLNKEKKMHMAFLSKKMAQNTNTNSKINFLNIFEPTQGYKLYK